MFEAHVCVLFFFSFEPSSSSNLTPVNISPPWQHHHSQTHADLCDVAFIHLSELIELLGYLPPAPFSALLFMKSSSSVLTVWCSPMWQEKQFKGPCNFKVVNSLYHTPIVS